MNLTIENIRTVADMMERAFPRETTPHSIRCSSFMYEAVRRMVSSVPQVPHGIGGMLIEMDPNLPLGTVEVLNRDGEVIKLIGAADEV